MSTPYTKKSGSVVEFELTLTDDHIKKQSKNVLEEFRKDVQVQGFRKGAAPDEMVVAQVGQERVYYESLNRAMNKEYQKFVADNNLKPVSEPKIEVKNEKKGEMPLHLNVSVEVYPDIEIGDYKKIKMDTPEIKVESKEIDTVIQQIMQDMGVFKTLDRKAEKNDFVVVDFEGKDEKGTVIPSTSAKEVVFQIGSGQFLPDLEKAFEGMKAGETKKAVKVSFPKDYHAQDMAGKKIPFDIALTEVREISAHNLDEETIQKIVGEKKDIQTFREDVEKIVRNKKEQEEQKKSVDAYNKKLVKLVKADIPASWIEDDVNMKIQNIKNSPQFQQNPESFWKAIKKTEEDLRKEFKTPAEEALKVFLALSKIVEDEQIELDKDDMQRAHQMAKGQSKGDNVDPMALSKAVLNLKIDKYFRGLTL